ncbi:HAMP domain-containing sensor histidine kinase [Parazoarcus communis]|uniref:histidine kinase n=2 Tax=Pseudomonadota TaxID=1224 RepID=A0A323UX53_9RHOO|nr:ATP-binding protein [Parazoarcus communis]NMG71191.1 HAMP domain-containing protein [Parazoarcus communis SWub3 = DSM 12120]PZA17047.1 histidine kinase [Azoarcus communis] [Parazoarcus communis SWub3 = DSM 12120]
MRKLLPTKAFTASLHARLSLMLALVVTVALLAGTALWLRETRSAIHEEITSASRVAEQWLNVLVHETRRDPEAGAERLMSALQAVGRIRAHALEVTANGNERLYLSPAPTYKAGREAPAWFAQSLTPHLPIRHFDAGSVQVSLYPDASRAVLDAWDDLTSMAGWGVAGLLLAWLGCHIGLQRALAPLRAVDAAFARGAEGYFDRRLPTVGARELDRLARSYNQLAERLDHSLADKAQLEAEQGLQRTIQIRLEEERRIVARELHDELAQGITAVRAIAGAIQQRSGDQPGIHGSAQAIIAMTGQMQDGVRAILHRLRDPAAEGGRGICGAIADWCAAWSALYPNIRLQHRLPDLDPELSGDQVVTVQRLLQESLTNVVRHADATQVEVVLQCDAGRLELRITDNGRGLSPRPGPADERPRFGLVGMHERVLALGGDLHFETPAGGGLSIRAILPLASNIHHGAQADHLQASAA